MFTKDEVEKEVARLMEIRNEFYEFLDENIPKDNFGKYDFSDSPKLEAKRVYELFYKLDYQARKLRGIIVNTYNLNP